MTTNTEHTASDPWKHTDHKYIGDGVYVSFDGFQLWLRLGAHDAEPLIALDPATFKALTEHGTRIFERAG